MAAAKIWKKLENRYTFGRIESSTVMVSAYIYIYIYVFACGRYNGCVEFSLISVRAVETHGQLMLHYAWQVSQIYPQQMHSIISVAIMHTDNLF